MVNKSSFLISYRFLETFHLSLPFSSLINILSHLCQPSSHPIKSDQQSADWCLYHQQIHQYFLKFHPFTFTVSTSLYSLDKVEFALFLKNHLPSIFQPIFHHKSAYDKHSINYSDRRFEAGQFGGRHHGFHQYFGRWKLFSETNILFLRTMKPLILYLSKLYKNLFYNDYKEAQKKVPKGWGLYGTIFTSVALNKDATNWHKDTKDTLWTILVYGGNFSGGELILGTTPPCKLQVKKGDIVFLRANLLFHMVTPFIGERFSLSCYSETITLKMRNSLSIDESGKEFLLKQS